jgi:hypothetical protein
MHVCFIVIQNQGVVPDAANKLGIKNYVRIYKIYNSTQLPLTASSLRFIVRSWKPVYKTRLRAPALFINGRAHSHFFLLGAGISQRAAVQLAGVLNFVKAELKVQNVSQPAAGRQCAREKISCFARAWAENNGRRFPMNEPASTFHFNCLHARCEVS